jgi:hypothetical protein
MGNSARIWYPEGEVFGHMMEKSEFITIMISYRDIEFYTNNNNNLTNHLTSG